MPERLSRTRKFGSVTIHQLLVLPSRIMSTVADLPAELLFVIAAHCGRDELKALRLANHAFLTAATEHLFREIHISPNTHSFDRAHNVAERDHLCMHVKSVVYHYGLLEDVYPVFEAFRREWRPARKPNEVRDPAATAAEAQASYACYLQELGGQRDFEEVRVEEDELERLGARLPSLDSISTVLDDVKPFTELHDYIGKRVGMAAAADNYGDGRFGKLFKAVVDKPLQKISARSIQWPDLDFIGGAPRGDPQQYRGCLRKLKFLEMGIYNALNDFEFDDDEDKDEYMYSVDNLGVFLREASHLTTLKLDFEELPFETHADEMLPISQTIFKYQWPELRELKLEAICAHEDALVKFLDAHKGTLKTLCLGDIELVEEGDKLPSVLTLFQSIRRALQLRACRITGNFTNRVDQAWYVDTEYNQQSCFRNQLEAYLCHQDLHQPTEVCQINEQEITQFWDEGLHLELWLHKVTGDYETFVDGSWYWCPELLADG